MLTVTHFVQIMIVGRLTGSSHSGCLQLKDSSGTIMVVCSEDDSRQDGGERRRATDPSSDYTTGRSVSCGQYSSG